MRRKIYQQMLEWKKKDSGSSALLLNGARRVGKSYIAEEFAKKEYQSYLLIDFTYLPHEVRTIFENDIHDLDLFFNKLSAYYRTALHKRNTLIIFDEVQRYPAARELIKYLVADGRYDYLETGSLISLRMNIENIVIPSEEEHLEMFPMDFEEFLWAMGDETTIPFLKECFEKCRPLGQAMHKRVMNDFRQYMLVGGMPQSVEAYLKTKSFEDCDRIKKRILTLYREDITKFVPITLFNRGQASRIFDRLHSEPELIVLKNNQPSAVILAPEEYTRLAKIEENYLLLLETTKRLAVNEHKAAIPEVELMEHFGIADSDLKEVEDLEIE